MEHSTAAGGKQPLGSLVLLVKPPRSPTGTCVVCVHSWMHCFHSAVYVVGGGTCDNTQDHGCTCVPCQTPRAAPRCCAACVALTWLRRCMRASASLMRIMASSWRGVADTRPAWRRQGQAGREKGCSEWGGGGGSTADSTQQEHSRSGSLINIPFSGLGVVVWYCVPLTVPVAFLRV